MVGLVENVKPFILCKSLRGKMKCLQLILCVCQMTGVRVRFVCWMTDVRVFIG